MASSIGYNAGSSLPCGPPWAAGTRLPHHGLPQGLQGSVNSSAWSSSVSSFCPDLGVCRAVPLICSHSSLTQLLCNTFYPFLNTSCPRCRRAPGCRTQMCSVPCVGGLEPPGSSCVRLGAALGSPHRGPWRPHCLCLHTKHISSYRKQFWFNVV